MEAPILHLILQYLKLEITEMFEMNIIWFRLSLSSPTAFILYMLLLIFHGERKIHTFSYLYRFYSENLIANFPILSDLVVIFTFYHAQTFELADLFFCRSQNVFKMMRPKICNSCR